MTVRSHYGTGSVILLPKSELPIMSVLLIDGSKNQRTYWADQLKRCTSGYEIVEAQMVNRGWIFTGLGELIVCCSNSHCLINRDSKH